MLRKKSSRLKETEEAGQVKAAHHAELDTFALKDTIGAFDETDRLRTGW